MQLQVTHRVSIPDKTDLSDSDAKMSFGPGQMETCWVKGLGINPSQNNIQSSVTVKKIPTSKLIWEICLRDHYMIV